MYLYDIIGVEGFLLSSAKYYQINAQLWIQL